MKLVLIANIIACVCAFVGFIYGSILFFRPKKALFPQIITLAVGCMAFDKLYRRNADTRRRNRNRIGCCRYSPGDEDKKKIKQKGS